MSARVVAAPMHDGHGDRADDHPQQRRGGGVGQPGGDAAEPRRRRASRGDGPRRRGPTRRGRRGPRGGCGRRPTASRRSRRSRAPRGRSASPAPARARATRSAPSRLCARRRPMSSVFTIRATAPYTPAVIARATNTRITARESSGSSATSSSAITMISAERMKSVRIAPLTSASSSSGCRSLTDVRGRRMRADELPQLLGALVAEVDASEHQDRRAAATARAR